MRPLIACHSHHWNNPIFISCMITEFYVIAWQIVWLSTTEGKNIVNLSAISQTCQSYSVVFNVLYYQSLKIFITSRTQTTQSNYEWIGIGSRILHTIMHQIYYLLLFICSYFALIVINCFTVQVKSLFFI